MDGVTGSVTASYNTLEHPNLSAYLTTQLGKAIVSLNYGYGGMSSKETENINYAERTYVASGNTMKGGPLLNGVLGDHSSSISIL